MKIEQGRMKLKMLATLVAFVVGLQVLFAQQPANPPFYKEVSTLKSKDSAAYPQSNTILFTGSSSFTKWTDVNAYFPGYKIVNRAFGGSSLPDLIRYADEVIIPYHPKQIVIYCGDNDLAASDSITPQIVLDRFKNLFTQIRNKLPQVHILYVAIKPSPSRERLMPKMVKANNLIKNFLKANQHTAFADVYQPMLVAGGKPNPTLFLQDNLHMNASGYVIWQKVLQPYLLQ